MRRPRNQSDVQEEEEEEEEEQHPFQQDHVDVTNLLDLFNRNVTPFPSPCILVIPCLGNLSNKLLRLEICRHVRERIEGPQIPN